MDTSELRTREPSLASPRLTPAPGSENLSIQFPSFPPPSTQLPPAHISFGKNCAPSQAPFPVLGKYDHLYYGQLRELCK